jgi:hypothetical protein
MILTAIGLSLGLASAIATARLLTNMLFQVQPGDPMVYLTVTVLLGVMALLATYVPARRASSIDPLATLRQEYVSDRECPPDRLKFPPTGGSARRAVNTKPKRCSYKRTASSSVCAAPLWK